jgi:thiopeptide-type bacteriocin biosynthesis protein
MRPGTNPHHPKPVHERWSQVSIRFASDEQAERETVTRLGPVLRQAESDGIIWSWFFIRKPWWRFRYLPATSQSADPARQLVEGTARDMANAGQSLDWARNIYEPETRAFGGDTAMTVAHELFHQDSHHIFASLSSPAHAQPDGQYSCPVGRRELSLLLCAAMMKSAGLDHFERGDVWAKVADLRLSARQAPAEEWLGFKTAVQRLTTVDTSPATALRTSGTLRSASAWLTAFEQAGFTLRKLADAGDLTRGLRAVIAHHVIFHWNRIGMPARTQTNLAMAASEVIFGDRPALADHAVMAPTLTRGC